MVVFAPLLVGYIMVQPEQLRTMQHAVLCYYNMDNADLAANKLFGGPGQLHFVYIVGAIHTSQQPICLCKLQDRLGSPVA